MKTFLITGASTGIGAATARMAVEAGYRESTESWAEVLRGLKRRGMRAPVLATGDGALGFWAAVRDVWPETREQRDWVHCVFRRMSATCSGRSRPPVPEHCGHPFR